MCFSPYGKYVAALSSSSWCSVDRNSLVKDPGLVCNFFFLGKSMRMLGRFVSRWQVLSVCYSIIV
jgi:hypothetical protein